ncbi:camphor resistance protein CrcB [alpha proteobacterium AAP81b]|nr:camphor resistance protein CrcB [alpha proteobacterium AAP81b]
MALVALGGGVGAVLRWLAGIAALRLAGGGFPWGTLAVNLAGALAMGVLAGWAARVGAAAEPWRLLLGTGVLGGFTTFSAFGLELALMLQKGETGVALGYIVASVGLGALAVFAGLMVAR